MDAVYVVRERILLAHGLTKTGNTLDVGQGAGLSVAADTVGVANLGITNAMIAASTIDLTTKVTGALPVRMVALEELMLQLHGLVSTHLDITQLDLMRLVHRL